MILSPELIEKTSFQIIDNEIPYPIDDKFKPWIYRVIHTTADFDFAHILEFHQEAVEKGCHAIKNGTKIYCDTKMIEAGVSKKLLEQFGCKIYTLIDSETVKKESIKRGITRSIGGIEKAARDPDTKVFVIGNAPTALHCLCDLIREKKVFPSLVIAVPVGFVEAPESKEAIVKSGVPCIVSRGRKGGSTVAVALLHAFLYQLAKEEK